MPYKRSKIKKQQGYQARCHLRKTKLHKMILAFREKGMVNTIILIKSQIKCAILISKVAMINNMKEEVMRKTVKALNQCTILERMLKQYLCHHKRIRKASLVEALISHNIN